MIGRSRELSELARLVGEVVDSGRAVVVQGDAGIGKTALVRATAELAARAGFRELRCTGLQSETTAGFAGLHELLHPVLDLVDLLPARQRAALSTAFGLAEGPAPERLLINLAVLGLLEEVAARQPLILVVEDLQWLDRSTVESLTFVARRLTQAPILLLFSARTGGTDATEEPLPGLPLTRIALAPLPGDEAGRLLDTLPVRLGDDARRQVMAEARGNPLALQEFAAALSTPHVEEASRLAGRLPTTRRLEKAFLGTARALAPASARMLLLSASAHGSALGELFAAGRLLGIVPADLDDVERAGLVSVTGDRLEFRHPLVRSAVCGAATTAERTAVHRALAEVTADPSRAAWHRAASAVGRDEAVATVLEEAAEEARRRGAQPEAVAALRRAATLSPERSDATRRLAAAAEIARRAGETAVSVALLDEAFPAASDARVLVALTTTRLLLSNTAGTPGPSTADLIALATQLAGPDGDEHPQERVSVLWAAAIECFGRALPADQRRAVEAELLRVDLPRWDPIQHMALALLDPVGRAAEERPALGRLAAALATDLLGQQILALTAESLQDVPTAARIWASAADLARRTGFSNDESQALRGRANTGLLLGRLLPALDDAEQALHLFEEMDLPLSTAATAAVLARARAWRGDLPEANAALTRSRELSAQVPLALVEADQAWAGGLIALTGQRYRDAWVELSQVSAHPTTALWALADLTEAAVRAGKAGAVGPVVEDAGRAAAALGSAHLDMLVARSRALLADGPTAEAHYEDAVAAGQDAGTPLELARTRLLYGEWLRRQRRPLPAREQLTGALHALDAAGARPWAERAAAELRAAGVVPARPGRAAGPDVIGALTPQELQVARLAARGLTNREIADQLYLSHRTVGAHLYHLYPKLGITARGQLHDVLAGRTADDPDPGGSTVT